MWASPPTDGPIHLTAKLHPPELLAKTEKRKNECADPLDTRRRLVVLYSVIPHILLPGGNDLYIKTFQKRKEANTIMKKKIIALCLIVALAATAVIGGTLAYFTDTTEAKVNEFTVGNVKIELTEPNWKGDATLMPGVVYDKDPTITVKDGSQDAYVFLKLSMNKYVSLVNLAGVDAYKNNVGGLTGDYPGFMAFMKMLMENNSLRETVVNRWFGGINHANWQIMNQAEIAAWVSGAADQTNPTTLDIVLGYIGDDDILSAGDSVTFMTSFGMPATVTASMFEGEDAYYIDGDPNSKSNFNTEKSDFKMTFTAYAIQTAEIADINAAYGILHDTILPPKA